MHKHHFLLFSKFFKLFWKLFFSRHYYTGLIDDDAIVYGGYGSGFYIMCKNGISLKVTCCDGFSYRKERPSYIVYVYYHNVFFMKYGEQESNFIQCFKNNKFIKCKSKNELFSLMDSLIKIFGKDSKFFEDSVVSNVASLEFENFMNSKPEKGFHVKTSKQYVDSRFDGSVYVNNKKYLIKETTFNSVCYRIESCIGDKSNLNSKLKEYLEFCGQTRFYSLFDYQIGHFIGFFIVFSEHITKSMHFYILENDKFITQDSSILGFGFVKENVYVDGKTHSVLGHFMNVVKNSIMLKPSDSFYTKANNLGLELTKKDKITPDLFEIFEMLNC